MLANKISGMSNANLRFSNLLSCHYSSPNCQRIFFRLQQKALGGCDPLAKDVHPSTAHAPTSKFVVALV